MSSTERRTLGLRLAAVALLVAAAGLSSSGFAAAVEVRETPRELDAPEAGPTVEVAVVSGALAAYGWVATKTYDLGKEVGKTLAAAPASGEVQDLGPGLEYLLD